MNIESIRNSYMPDKINLLLVGESPPSGGDFFYIKSNMTKFTARAFELAHSVNFPENDQKAFLEYFKKCGCFLDDISHEQLDKLYQEIRERKLAESVTGFAERLFKFQPAFVSVVVKRVEIHTRIALAIANVDAPISVLPFPGYGHQNKYIKAMERIIREINLMTST